MRDLQELVDEIEKLPGEIFEASIVMADSENKYETLKEEIKHKRAAIALCYNEKSMARAELQAYASEEYKQMLSELSKARLAYLRDSARYEFLLKCYDSNKTQQIALMSQMKLQILIWVYLHHWSDLRKQFSLQYKMEPISKALC